jgi:hypothetical protein
VAGLSRKRFIGGTLRPLEGGKRRYLVGIVRQRDQVQTACAISAADTAPTILTQHHRQTAALGAQSSHATFTSILAGSGTSPAGSF